MASDPRKRQKKLERRAAKRKEKKHEIVREQSRGLGERLTAATRLPVLHAYISDALESEGIGWVILSRALPDESIAVAVFLVDRHCLGVKDAFARLLPRSEYEGQLLKKMRQTSSVRTVSPATARKVVESAVAYARDLGIPPHPDYARAKLLFGDIDASTSTEEIEFGDNGKPLFIAGPYDTPQRCRHILNILTESCGPNGFHFIVPASVAGKLGAETLPTQTEIEEDLDESNWVEDDE